MANFASTSIVVRIQLLDTSLATTYTGNAVTAAYVWGAQLELGEHVLDMIADLENFRYTRTRGSSSSYIGVRFGTDTSPDLVTPDERNYKSVQVLAHKAGVAQDVYINTNNSSRSNAPQSAEEVFVNYRSDSAMAKRWYQLAPYYASYAHVVDYPTDTTDHVRIGSKQSGARTSNNNFENIAFFQIPATLRDTATVADTTPGKFYDKGFHETKTIPRIPKFDAAQVTGIFDHYKAARNISSSNYITLSGSYTYYRAYNWFSLTPNTRWSRFAFGSGDRLGPVMQEIFDFTDTLSFTQTYKLPPDFQIMSERISNSPNISAKRSRYDDLYAQTSNYTSSNSAQVAEIFDNYKTASVLGKRWYELSPYYASYNHTYISAQSPDQISLSAREFNARNIIQDYYDINSGAMEDYQSDSGTEDFQVIAT